MLHLQRPYHIVIESHFRALFVLSLICLFLTAPSLPAGEQEKQSYVPGQVFIKFEKDLTPQDIEAFIDHRQLTVIRRYRLTRAILVKTPCGWTVPEAIKILSKEPEVEYVEPNYISRIQATIPDDPDFDRLWGLHNTGQYVNGAAGTADADIDAPEAWDTETGASHSITVAVLDTGIDYTHEDLSGNIWQNPGEIADNGVDDDGNGYTDDTTGWDFVNSDNDPDDDNTEDEDGKETYDYHGTHVAGIIGAAGNNATGITGVSWHCRLMPLKIAGKKGTLSDDKVIAAIEYAAEKGADVINASFGSSIANATLRDTIDASGILLVAAAGNDSTADADYPARYTKELDNVISVAASGQTDTIAGFSNYSTSSVDVAAPGVNIWSTKSANAPDGAKYQFESGTSMATATVTGLAALIMASDSSLTYRQVKSKILNGVDVLSVLADKTATSGRVNANASLAGDKDLPSPPSGLTATVVSSNRINLTWTDESNNETGFVIERKTGSAIYQQIATPDADTTSYADSALLTSTKY